MIPYTELRIGNWINEQDLELQVGMIRQDLFDASEPIPLTEEWLLKFGFENMNDPDVLVYCKSFGKFDGEDYDDAIVITRDSQNQWYFSLGRKVIVNYVHQQQNLYFALTGEELVFSPSVVPGK